MSKKRRGAARGGRVTPKGTRPGAPRRGGPTEQRGRARDTAEPDLMDDVADALATGEPIALLGLASALLDALTSRPSPFEPPGLEPPPLAELVLSFVEVECPETTALLAALAPMLDDDLAARSARRELDRRRDDLPAWLSGLDRAEVGPVLEVADLLGDASNVLVEVRLADGEALTAVAFLHHAAGSAVADAFVVPGRLEVVAGLMDRASPTPHLRRTELDPADARVRLAAGVRFGEMMLPPFETETWPAMRPLVRWVVGLLPEGGQDVERPEWSETEEQALIERFVASDEGRAFDDEDHRDLMTSLMWLGTSYGLGDPLLWSPSRVEQLLLDQVPRKVMAPAPLLAKLPNLLRAWVAFGHRERAIPEDLTGATLMAIGELLPEYREAISDPDRPQGPEALATMVRQLIGGSTSSALADVYVGALARIEQRVGGPEALAALDTGPLPDEPIDLSGVPDDVLDRVREVAELCDRACDALLDVEARTASRRLLAHLAREGPEVFRRRGRADTAAAAVCWAVARESDLLGGGEGQVWAKDLLGHFGLTGSISTRAGTLLRACGLQDAQGRTTFPPEMWVSSARRSMVTDAARYRSLLADEPTPSDEPTLFPLPPRTQPDRPTAPAGAGPTAHRLKVTLQGIRPPVWRRLEVPSTTTLADLHHVLQVAFGWFDGHLHGFAIGDDTFVPEMMLDGWSPVPQIDEASVTLAEVLTGPGASGTYTYDFGDNWEHRIAVEAVEPLAAGVTLPRCTAGRRAGPPEDVGGTWGYEHLLEVLADPSHPEHDEMAEWVELPFDPERFDTATVTRDLRSMFPAR